MRRLCSVSLNLKLNGVCADMITTDDNNGDDVEWTWGQSKDEEE
jgi:hypothetical protein